MPAATCSRRTWAVERTCSSGAVTAAGTGTRATGGGAPVEAAGSHQVQEFSRQSVEAWAEVVKGSGTATDEQLAAATQVSLAQFAPDLATPPAG